MRISHDELYHRQSTRDSVIGTGHEHLVWPTATAIQFTIHCVGWTFPRALHTWKALSMGRVGIHHWPLCSRPFLAYPPIFSKVASRLLVHSRHRVSQPSHSLP